LKVSDYVFKFLAEQGVKHVFTLPGGFSMHLNDSLNYSKITPVYCLHESGAGFAACGYASYTKGLGVVLVTSGPGSTNVLTAVASAYQDSLPLLILSGEAKVVNIVKRDKHYLRQAGPQDVPIDRIARRITKYINTVICPQYLSATLECAIDEALKPRRGPVWLALPLDVQAAEC
jgi:acetolactate synthase-1/2/3 large subunit